MRLGFTLVCSAAMLALIGVPVAAKEYPIGKAQEKDGMEIGAVYLQPIEMAPPRNAPRERFGRASEFDIKAAKDNKNGFAQGDWVPYLAVDYEVVAAVFKEPSNSRRDRPIMRSSMSPASTLSRRRRC